MPYKIIKRKGGYFVAKKTDTAKRFSKKPLTKTMATKQMQAIIISENKSKK